MKTNNIQRSIYKIYLKIKKLLDLKEDFDEVGARQSILANTEFKSANAWGLIFAIFIASVGLHVNSTAVVIGAMLISPLMGPIVGAGFSLAIHDFESMKRSLSNLLYAVGISVFTSTVFFLFAPSSGAQSELIARTQPNFYDVLIALFGGATGIIAHTRKTKGNAIPGVAIATALMPPLCTVGYGIATLNPLFSIGALYLFLINTIFIFLSTYIIVRLLSFSTLHDKNPLRDKIIHKWMSIASGLIVLPSLFTVWYLHKKTSFENSAKLFIENEIATNKLIVGKPNLSFGLTKSSVGLKVFSEPYSESELNILLNKLKNYYGLKDSTLIIESESKDILTDSELNQKYISKQEFLNFQKEKAKIENDKLQLVLSEINTHPEIIKLKKFSKLNLKNDLEATKIEIEWKSKPTKFEIDSLEKTLLQLVMKGHYSIVHK